MFGLRICARDCMIRNRRRLASAFIGPCRLALPTPFDGAVEVCDAIPQRNCGRFSRPSPDPQRCKEHERARGMGNPIFHATK